eukprot:6214612-Pleurochrysis_carterae.AAC.2
MDATTSSRSSLPDRLRSRRSNEKRCRSSSDALRQRPQSRCARGGEKVSEREGVSEREMKMKGEGESERARESGGEGSRERERARARARARARERERLKLRLRLRPRLRFERGGGRRRRRQEWPCERTGLRLRRSRR